MLVNFTKLVRFTAGLDFGRVTNYVTVAFLVKVSSKTGYYDKGDLDCGFKYVCHYLRIRQHQSYPQVSLAS